MALITVTNIPSDRVPFIDERTGMVSRAWYRFFLRLFDLTSAGDNAFTIQSILSGPPILIPTSSSSNPVFNIALTSSPFTYQNLDEYTVDVLVGGDIGGVVNLEFSRDGVTWFGTGSFYGQFTLSPYDYIRITYVAAPIVTGIPR